VYSATAVIFACATLAPAIAQNRRNYSFNVTDSNAENCAGVTVSSSNGGAAKVTEAFTMTHAEAPIIELAGSGNVQIRVRGWARPDYSVEVCKLAVAGTQAEAEQLARSIAVGHAAGRLTYNGPAVNDGQWSAVFLVHAPKDARVDLETSNGPIEVREIDGDVKLRAANGPVAVRNCGGNVQVNTRNGPIAFTGDRGDVHLVANNGPIALHFSAEAWNGAQLEARTINGPMSVSMPEGFRTGVRLETTSSAPISCASAICRNAAEEEGVNHRTLRMNGGSDTVRLSTENGPVSIHSGDRTR
jgi:hypothetical protein